jgi:formate dehydrogenase maturation protein FdhE
MTKYKPMTEEIRKKYEKNKGRSCPFCGSPDLQRMGSVIGNLVVTRDVACNACEMAWMETYKLIKFNFIAKQRRENHGC